MSIPATREGGTEHAEYLGARAMLYLEVFPSKRPGLYSCAVYKWFDRKPLFVSGSESSLEDAKKEVEREAARLVGYAGPGVEWLPRGQLWGQPNITGGRIPIFISRLRRLFGSD